jgi:hypothetical protein
VDEVEIRDRIEMLKQDHRDLDAAIDALRLLPMPDMIQLQRFKKKKLLLKDEIAMLEDLLARAKTTGLTGFAMVWTEKARAVSTAYTITDERYALIGGVAELQHNLITRGE